MRGFSRVPRGPAAAATHARCCHPFRRRSPSRRRRGGSMRAASSAWTVSGTFSQVESSSITSRRHHARAPPGRPARRQVLTKNGIAFGPGHDHLAQARRQLLDHAPSRPLRERLEPDRGGVPAAGAPARARIEQLRPVTFAITVRGPRTSRTTRSRRSSSGSSPSAGPRRARSPACQAPDARRRRTNAS